MKSMLLRILVGIFIVTTTVSCSGIAKIAVIVISPSRINFSIHVNSDTLPCLRSAVIKNQIGLTVWKIEMKPTDHPLCVTNFQFPNTISEFNVTVPASKLNSGKYTINTNSGSYWGKQKFFVQ